MARQLVCLRGRRVWVDSGEVDKELALDACRADGVIQNLGDGSIVDEAQADDVAARHHVREVCGGDECVRLGGKVCSFLMRAVPDGDGAVGRAILGEVPTHSLTSARLVSVSCRRGQ